MKKRVEPLIAQKIPQEVWEIFKKFSQKGYEIYLVGAGVRALLQHKTPTNCDFTTNAPPRVVQALFKDAFYDNRFGTVGIPLETRQGKEVYEITTYRTEEGYSDKRRPDQVRWGQELKEDLKRRDFTWNAIVIGPKLTDNQWDQKSLELIDLFNGQNDFDNRLVRTVGNPHQRFAEDALRMMRAIRFAAQLGFTIEEKTLAAIQKNAHLIGEISGERIREELFKIMKSQYPADGYLLLRNSGLAAKILPEAERMFGVEQKSPGRHHLDDVGTHAIKSLRASRSSDPIINLAILLHDVGKPVVARRNEKGIITFYNHEVVGASIANNIARRLCFSKKDRERLVKLVRWHQFTVDERQTDRAIRRFIRNVGKENLTAILQVRTADRLGGGARETSWRLERFKKKLVEVQKQPFSVTDLKVNGHDVMNILGLQPGPLVGKILNQLFEEVVKDKTKNTRVLLLKRIQKFKKEKTR